METIIIIICNIGKVLLALAIGIMFLAVFVVFGSHDSILSEREEILHFVIPLLIGIIIFVITLVALFQA